MSNPVSEEALANARVEAHVSRDLDVTARLLTEWLRPRLPDADHVTVSKLVPPSVGGGSSETLFFTLKTGKGGNIAHAPMVLRIDPTSFRLFLRRNFDAQYRLLDWLSRETDVPIPAIHFYEPGCDVLGAPFWIMDHVAGEVPPDNPSYNAAGFLFEATVENRRRLWRNGMEILGKLARLDQRQLPNVVELQPGVSGQEENLRHWTQSMYWACEDKPIPLLHEVNRWLYANLPERLDTGLSWGDARIGNMVFYNWDCVGVLDWETITLAGPQLDLAHWLLMDDYSAQCLGLPRLPGLGSRAETIALWEELTGREADQLDWHELLACFRLAVVMERYARQWALAGRNDLRDARGDTLMARHLRSVFARVAL